MRYEETWRNCKKLGIQSSFLKWIFVQFLSQLGVRPWGRSLPRHVPGSTNMSFVYLCLRIETGFGFWWIWCRKVSSTVIFLPKEHMRGMWLSLTLAENCVSSWSMDKYRKVEHIGNSLRYAQLSWISIISYSRVARVSAELLCKSPSFLCFRRNLCIATAWPTRWRWRAVICQDLLSDLQPIRMTEISSETKRELVSRTAQCSNSQSPRAMPRFQVKSHQTHGKNQPDCKHTNQFLRIENSHSQDLFKFISGESPSPCASACHPWEASKDHKRSQEQVTKNDSTTLDLWRTNFNQPYLNDLVPCPVKIRPVVDWHAAKCFPSQILTSWLFLKLKPGWQATSQQQFCI